MAKAKAKVKAKKRIKMKVFNNGGYGKNLADD